MVMPKNEDMENWIKDNIEVETWLTELQTQSPKTAGSRKCLLHNYFVWLKEKRKINSARQLFNEYKALKKEGEEFKHIDLLKQYVKSIGEAKSCSWRESVVSTVKGFYRDNHYPFPNEKINVTVQETDMNNLREDSAYDTMDLEGFRKLIGVAKIREKSCLLILLQSGMGQGEFKQFNTCTCTKDMVKKHGHVCIPTRVMQQLRENKNPIKIYPLIARKQRNLNSNHSIYYTYISTDAINSLKEYLVFRKSLVQEAIKTVKTLEAKQANGRILKWEKIRIQRLKERLKVISPMWQEGESLFITNTLNPMTESNIQHSVGILKKQTGQENKKFTPHTTRTLFKTTCSHAGVKDIVSEFWFRHKLDSYGYNQLDKMHPEDMVIEYSKVAKYLNIISEFEEKPSQKQIKELEQDLSSLQFELQMYKMERIVSFVITRYPNMVEMKDFLASRHITEDTLDKAELSCLQYDSKYDKWSYNNTLDTYKMA